MKLRWTQQARTNLRDILIYIAEDNPSAARRMKVVFEAAADRLIRFPLLGHPSRLPGKREFIPHPSYRLLYEVTDVEIVVHALVHTSRQWPPEPEDGR